MSDLENKEVGRYWSIDRGAHIWCFLRGDGVYMNNLYSIYTQPDELLVNHNKSHWYMMVYPAGISVDYQVERRLLDGTIQGRAWQFALTCFNYHCSVDQNRIYGCPWQILRISERNGVVQEPGRLEREKPDAASRRHWDTLHWIWLPGQFYHGVLPYALTHCCATI